MASVLLAIELLAAPITNGYALMWNHKDVVVCVTFAGKRPTKVCSHIYSVDDKDMAHDIDRPHCWTPKNDIGSLDIWPNVRLDEANWKVIVTYPDRPTDTLYLVSKVNS